MDPYFSWIEQTAFSLWMRESPSLLAFPTVLIFHTVGMAFLAGSSVAIDLRILGFAPRMRLAPMQRFFPVMWAGFWVAAASGVALLIAYPTKALENPIFYIKLLCIALAVAGVFAIRNLLLRDPEVDDKPMPMKGKALAIGSLLCWVAAITTGRLLAYTYVRMMTGE